MPDKFDPDVLMAAIEKLAPDIQAKFKSGQKIDGEMLRELSTLAPALVEYLAGVATFENPISVYAVVDNVQEIKRDSGETVTKVILRFPREQNPTFVSSYWVFEYIGRATHKTNDVVTVNISVGQFEIKPLAGASQ